MVMVYSALFIDLDDTVYPSSTGLWLAIRDRMSQFMIDRMNLPRGEVETLRASYFQKYGTTLRGLQAHHDVDAGEFLTYVHDLPLDRFLTPAPGLRDILLSLPIERWIFTNADRNHARRVLAALDLDGVFEGIIDIWALDFICKPDRLAYQRAMTLAGQVEPSRCVMIDDSKSNLDGARAAGFKTILVTSEVCPDTNGHVIMPALAALPVTMPELWQV